MEPVALVLGAAGLLLALATIGRFLNNARRAWLRVERVLAELLGTPADPANDVEAVPSLRVRVDKVAADVNEVKGALPHLALGLEVERLAEQLTGVQAQLVDVRSQSAKTDARVTDHRRRNDEHADQMRRDLDARNREVDRRFDQTLKAIDRRLPPLPTDSQDTET